VYKMRAQNKWGWSDYSVISDAILAATVPERVSIPETQIDTQTGGVLITWQAPYFNGASIDAYQVEVMDSNGLWKDFDTTETSTVVSMATLIDELGLSYEDLVVVRVSASNLMGQGPWSMSNTAGALVRTVPQKMLTVSKGSLSTATSL